MSDTTGDDIPRDPWGNPLPPEDRPPANPTPDDYPPPFPSDEPGGATPPPWPGSPPSRPPSDNPAWPGAQPPQPTGTNPAWPGAQHPSPPPDNPAWPGPTGPTQQGPQLSPAPPPGVPSQGWGQGAPWAPARNDGMAIGALVCGILAGVCGLAGIAGVILGPVAIGLALASRRRIRAAAGTLRGDGLAVTGLVLGILGTAISVVWLVVFIANPNLVQDLIDRLSTTTTTTTEPG